MKFLLYTVQLAAFGVAFSDNRSHGHGIVEGVFSLCMFRRLIRRVAMPRRLEDGPIIENPSARPHRKGIRPLTHIRPSKSLRIRRCLLVSPIFRSL